MSEWVAPAAAGRGERDDAAPAGADLLALQRAALRALRDADQARAALEDGARSEHAAAAARAEAAAIERRRRSGRRLEQSVEAARSAAETILRNADATLEGEVRTASARADDARNAAACALGRIGMAWVTETGTAGVATHVGAAQFQDAVARAEAAVAPLCEAVRAVEQWRRTRASLLKALVPVAAVLLLALLIARAKGRSPASDAETAFRGPAVTLSPEEEGVAVAGIRHSVRAIDRASTSLSRRYRTGSGRGSGTAYFDGAEVRRVVIRQPYGIVTETYYQGGDVIFRYEHVPNPARPTDGKRYYYRAGLPVRVRYDTNNLVRGTEAYTSMDPEGVRHAALREMEQARAWSPGP